MDYDLGAEHHFYNTRTDATLHSTSGYSAALEYCCNNSKDT